MQLSESSNELAQMLKRLRCLSRRNKTWPVPYCKRSAAYSAKTANISDCFRIFTLSD
jgi:hypothetical protein